MNCNMPIAYSWAESLSSVAYSHCLVALSKTPTSIWLLILFPLFVLPLWRLWTSTIAPVCYPDAPRDLPYWIPGTFIAA